MIVPRRCSTAIRPIIPPKNYDVPFGEADHIRLRDTLANIKGKFLLSYNDDDFVRELYKDFKIEEVERQNNISVGKFKELIITNY